MNKLEKVRGSSPVYGSLLNQARELLGQPPQGETSLQRYDGTNVYQWHYRTAVYWQPWGELMFLEADDHGKVSGEEK